jgi:hypothetical protein
LGRRGLPFIALKHSIISYGAEMRRGRDVEMEGMGNFSASAEGNSLVMVWMVL